MEVNNYRGAVQIKHKKQSSHDSGTFLDWDEPISHINNVNGRSEPLDNQPLQFNSNVTGEFVTVVAVEAKDNTDQVDSPNNNFVTVLTVNTAVNKVKDLENGIEKNDPGSRETRDVNRNVDENISFNFVQSEKDFTKERDGRTSDGKSRNYSNSNEEVNSFVNGNRDRFHESDAQFIEREILVYRLPGERLGFGLKFEGGLQTNQKVNRLFVQSCAPDSPASRTGTPWGHFTPGDEIVRINNIGIHELSRIDCVKFLKESTVVLKLFVRHLKSSSDVHDDRADQTPVKPLGAKESCPKTQTGRHSEDGQSQTPDETSVNVTSFEAFTNTPDSHSKSVIAMDVKGENSSPPPIPPRKLLKRTSNTSVVEKRRTSPKASPRSLIKSGDTDQSPDKKSSVIIVEKNNQNKTIVGEEQKREEFYEVDLKLSDEDIDEIIESLDKTENEEAMRITIENRMLEKCHVMTDGKQALLDINDNMHSIESHQQSYQLGHNYHSGIRSVCEVAEAEFYTNLFLDSNDTLFESESDDTGSSHTTAIDRLSLHSSDRISLTSSSSFSDIKSLNSYEFDLESNIDNIIDFDKVLEPLEGGVETLPIKSTVQNAGTEALYGPYVIKNVVNEEQILSKKFDETEKNVTDVSKSVETTRFQKGQEVSNLKGQSDLKLQSPKPLPRTDVQKMKFKSGKKMPPPPPPPSQKMEVEDRSTTIESDIVCTIDSSLPENENSNVHVKSTEPIANVKSANPTVCNKENKTSSEVTIEIQKSIHQKPEQLGTLDIDRTVNNEFTNSANESNENNLYTTVEQIPIVDHLLPKVIKAQEKVPNDTSSPTYKSSSDLSILETIVENDENHHHLPRLIDFVPKDKIKSLSPEKSKKLNAIIYEQQKVVEYFTSPHVSPSGKNTNRTAKQKEAKCATSTSTVANYSHATQKDSTDISLKTNVDEKKEALDSELKTKDNPKKLAMGTTDALNNNEIGIDESSESLNKGLLDEKTEDDHQLLLGTIDRRADGGEQDSTDVCENGREVAGMHEVGIFKDHGERVDNYGTFPDAIGRGSSEDHERDDSSGTLSAISNSSPSEIDLKLCDGIAPDIGTHEFVSPQPSPSDAMMPAPVDISLPHSTRLPPDGHEFPQSYQELHTTSALPADLLSYPAKPNYPAKPQTMIPTNGLPPLPTSNPPVTRKLSRPSGDSRDLFSRDFSTVGREVSPRKELTPPRREAMNGSNTCDNKTDLTYSRFNKVADSSPNYKYGNKDERSERSVRDKIAMFSNKSTGKQASCHSSPTHLGGQNNVHKFVEPIKRTSTREESPFGSPITPVVPVKDVSPMSVKKVFKNDEIVSHNYLTNIEVDNSYLQNHYQEGVNCQSESSAYSSLSTSEILYDKNADFNGLNGNNGYPIKGGYDTSDYVNGSYIKNAASVQENRDSDRKISDVINTNNVNNVESTKRTDSVVDIYKQKYTQDLSTTRQSDKSKTNHDIVKSNPNKFNSESRTSCDNKGYYTLNNRSSGAKTPEYKVNDFSSLPRKLKVLKSLDQECRESSPESGGGYTSKLTRTISFNSPPLLHTRSQSMIDINRNNGADSISKLIEKRKKNISKLKGLIIPEKSEIPASYVAICNLPEIKVKTPHSFLSTTELLDQGANQQSKRLGIIKPVPLERTVSNPLDQKQTNGYERKRNNSVDNTIDQVDIGRNLETENVRMATSTWDLNDIPKYSPAFKRKSLTVYDKPKQFANLMDGNSTKKVSPPKPPRKSYEGKINNEQIDAIISFDRIKENCKTRKVEPAKICSSESEDAVEKPLENGRKIGVINFDSPRSVDIGFNSPEDKHIQLNSVSDWKSKDSTTCVFENLENENERLKSTDRLGVKKLNILTAYDTESSGSDDNDSAISSNVSPPLSPLKREETEGRSQERKISTNSSSSSTLTSGDDSIHYQAGDGQPKRILKPQSVEAVNRKNVLSSAKFRSGDKTNEPIVKENEPIHEDLARCVDNRLKSVKVVTGFQSEIDPRRSKMDDDEYSSSTLNDNEEEDFEFNDECTDKIYSRRLSNIKVAYLDVQVDSAESSDDILSSSDLISEGANSDDEMSVTSSECRNGRAELSATCDDWGNTPDEICSKIEEYIDDLEMYSQEIEEKRSKLISERTKRVRRTQESVKIDKFVRTNEFLRNAKLSEANEKLAISPEHKGSKEKELQRTPSRSRLDRLKKDIGEPETTETEASIDEAVPKPAKLPSKPSLLAKSTKADGKSLESSKIDEIKSVYSRSVSTTEISTAAESITPLSRKPSGVSVVRKLADHSKANGSTLTDYAKMSNTTSQDFAKSNASAVLPTRLTPSHHMRVSSLDSTTSDDSFTMQREQFGSITSIASSTSLISQQELQQLIDESNQCLDDSSAPSLIPGTSEVSVVVLHRDLPGNSVGITLAGGSDYESKEITVHKVISGTPADRDGRLQKGDRILSINGKSMKGLTHKESLAILKTPRSQTPRLVVSRWKPSAEGDTSVSASPNVSLRSPLSPSISTSALGCSLPSSTPSNAFSTSTNGSTPIGSNSVTSSTSMTLSSSPLRTAGERPGSTSALDVFPVQTGGAPSVARGPPMDITLIKDGAGLGFSLEGGKDSPLGDQPLTIKKIFTGGCAEKNGQLQAGDEIVAINGVSVSDMSRIDAWSLLKKLNDGSVLLTLRHRT